MDPLSLIQIAAPLASLLGEGVASLFSDDAADQKKAGLVAQVVVDAASKIAGAPVTADNVEAFAARMNAAPTELLEFSRSVNGAILDLMKLDNEDRASARTQTIELAKAGSRIAWGAPVVSLVVLLTFGLVLFLVLTKSIPPGQETTVSLMLGALQTMAVSVVAYWVGSTAGSRAKDDLIRSSLGTR